MKEAVDALTEPSRSEDLRRCRVGVRGVGDTDGRPGAMLRQIQKSLPNWTAQRGRRDYLEFVSEHIP